MRRICILFLFVLLVAFLVLRKWVHGARIMLAICCIDPRADEIPACSLAIETAFGVRRIHKVGVIRNQDVQCAAAFESCEFRDILRVPDYTAPSPGKRHNYDGLAAQRTAAWHHAQAGGYDCLIFVDSDIHVRPDTLPYLLWGLALGADACAVPYGVRWADMRPVLGYGTPAEPRIEAPRAGLWPYHACTAAGMGCTALWVPSPRLPDRFAPRTVLGKTGEDIGFFVDAQGLGARVWSADWATPVEHAF